MARIGNADREAEGGGAGNGASGPPGAPFMLHPQAGNAHFPASASADPHAVVALPVPSLSPIRRLIGHANDLLRLAAELELRGASGLSVDDRGPARTQPAGGDDIRWLEQARRAYRERRSRAEIFGVEDLFGEPAWDLLLDLFIAAKENKRVPVTSACIGAAVPTTTALRWLTVLEHHGLVVREADPSDARRVFVRLSAKAYTRMVTYFTRAARLEGEESPGGPDAG